MDAQRISIALHDESAGYAVTPGRVPLTMLRNFVKDVDDLLRGDAGDVGLNELEVAVEQGSLAIVTAPTAASGLIQDLLSLASSEFIDGLNARRRAVIARWQKAARSSRKLQVRITAPILGRVIVIDAASDYRADDADQWVQVERYVRGEVVELGGTVHVNAHIRLPDGKQLVVNVERDVLRADRTNRLFKPAMVRIRADYNVVTREHRNARLIEFIEHAPTLDEEAFERSTQRGAKAWADVQDASAWVDALRGNDA